MEGLAMQIGNFFPLENGGQVDFFSQSRERNEAAVQQIDSGDTVSISAEALALARQMYASAFGASLAREEDAADEGASSSQAVNDYKSIFNDYRGMGLFVEDSGTAAGAGTAGDSEADTDSASRQMAKLEKQIQDLMKELESVMSSSMPEVQKESAANEIQKKISELQSTLGTLKRAAQAASPTAAQA